jgi:hypothetical protein
VSQPGFDFARDSSVRTSAPVVPAERTRLSRQCRAILSRLKQGPATNVELATLALKYTGRISDLRRSGYQVTAYDRNRQTGVTWYRLGGQDGA